MYIRPRLINEYDILQPRELRRNFDELLTELSRFINNTDNKSSFNKFMRDKEVSMYNVDV